MDSYLSNIDNYIQEQENQQHQQQQQLYYLHQQQQQQQQQQHQQQTFDPTQWATFNTNDFTQSVMNIPEPTMYMPSTTATSTASTMGYAPHPHHLQHHSLPLPPPGFDIHGNPIKIRKKPGRKPNPASPALRKMQNRAAQRAFRERKERHLKDLENTIKTLREQRNTTAKELKKVKNKLEVYKTENWYLKGVMLTLQFMCMHHNIDLPPHTPYLAEEVLMEMAKTHPHAIEAYVNAYTRNNLNLKPNLSPNYNTKSSSSNTNSSSTASLVNKHEQQQQQQQQQIAKESIHSPSSTATNQFGSMSLQDHPSSESISSPQSSSALISSTSNHHHHHHHHQEEKEGKENKREQQEEEIMMDHDMKQEYMEYKQEQHEDDMSPAPMTPKTQSSLTFEHDDVAKWTMDDAEDDDDDEEEEDNKGHSHGGQEKDHEGKIKNKNTHPTTSLGAIQRIRLQLRVQSTLSTISGGDLQSDRLQPTLLQLAIPHDLRIDLIPAPMMRDRMIIFRDQMDYDRCFSMLLNGAVYHGGDPTLSQSWELPPSFHSEYWFLSSRYDLETTNRWRRLKNLPEIPPGDPHRRQWTPPPSTLSCQQLDQQQQQHENGDAISSPSSTSSTNYVSKHPLYDKVLGIPPELRHTVTSPTLDMMMEMMNALSPNKTNAIKDA